MKSICYICVCQVSISLHLPSTPPRYDGIAESKN